MNRKSTFGLSIAASILATMLLTQGCAICRMCQPDQVITMNDLPAAVKTLAEKETAGCRIIEVEKEQKAGRTIYAITYDQAGTKMELEYAEDGKLISKGKE